MASLEDAKKILEAIGMPEEQLNDRTAICLLALLDLKPSTNWKSAKSPMLGIRGILDFAREEFKIKYAENTRESIRKYSVKQLVEAGVVVHNPDDPKRSTNSSNNCYQVDPTALELFKAFKSSGWKAALAKYLSLKVKLVEQYAKRRDVNKIPLKLKSGIELQLSPGSHSELIKAVIDNFGSIFVPGGDLVYVGDTGTKWGYFNLDLLQSLGVEVSKNGKMPDVVIYYPLKNWLILVEAVTSSGPVDSVRYKELTNLFRESTAGLVYVTAFLDRGDIFRKFLSVVAWETEVWCASDPTHLIHFNGDRFLGPR